MPVHYHDPVMVEEVLSILRPVAEHTIVDGTLGSGGHALVLARRIGKGGTLIGLDRDPEMLAIGRERLERELRSEEKPRLFFAAKPYEESGGVLAQVPIIGGVDAVLLDLGVNSLQLEDGSRGFAFSREGPLDGRFNPAEGGRSIADLVNSAGERELADIFRLYGDERLARPIARRIVREREKKAFETTKELAALVWSCYPPAQRQAKIHPATRVMQACRIAVNDELGGVTRGVRACMDQLKVGGRMAVLTFHSGEDRIVKQLFKDASSPRPDRWNPYSATTMEGVEFRLVESKAIKCSGVESDRNPRARSAKLRSIERIAREADHA